MFCDTTVPSPAAGHLAVLQCPHFAQLSVSGLVWLVLKILGLRWPAVSASSPAPKDDPSLSSADWWLVPDSEPSECRTLSVTAEFTIYKTVKH